MGGIRFRFFAGLCWMAGWAVAAGLVNFSGRAGLLAFLTSVADADGCASGEITLIGNLHVAGLNFVRRSFRWGGML